jgi:hypothetical protein
MMLGARTRGLEIDADYCLSLLRQTPNDLLHCATIPFLPDLHVWPRSYSILTQDLDQFLVVMPYLKYKSGLEDEKVFSILTDILHCPYSL